MILVTFLRIDSSSVYSLIGLCVILICLVTKSNSFFIYLRQLLAEQIMYLFVRSLRRYKKAIWEIDHDFHYLKQFSVLFIYLSFILVSEFYVSNHTIVIRSHGLLSEDMFLFFVHLYQDLKIIFNRMTISNINLRQSKGSDEFAQYT